LFWLGADFKTARRITRLIAEIQRNPFGGIGKPEPLKGELSGYWSRRIDDEHRLV
jgi:toxin YoeB